MESSLRQPSLRSTVVQILDRAVSGQRITDEEALVLFEHADLATLGEAADAVACRLHPENYRTYNIDRLSLIHI